MLPVTGRTEIKYRYGSRIWGFNCNIIPSLKNIFNTKFKSLSTEKYNKERATAASENVKGLVPLQTAFSQNNAIKLTINNKMRTGKIPFICKKKKSTKP